LKAKLEADEKEHKEKSDALQSQIKELTEKLSNGGGSIDFGASTIDYQTLKNEIKKVAPVI